MTALARASSNYKRQINPLIRGNKDYGSKYSVEKELLVVSLKRLVAKTN
jgi:hypothetical protein